MHEIEFFRRTFAKNFAIATSAADSIDTAFERPCGLPWLRKMVRKLGFRDNGLWTLQAVSVNLKRMPLAVVVVVVRRASCVVVVVVVVVVRRPSSIIVVSIATN